MSRNLNSRLFPMLAIAALCMAEAEAATSAGAPASTEVPSTNADAVAPAAAKTRAPKNPENTLNIINGRLPLPLVFMIRFDTLGSKTNNENAKCFGTSVGKVFDIKKGRNFGYIDAAYKPSAEEMAAAKAWCETGKTAKGQSLKEAGGDPDAILKALESMGVASAEEVAKRNWSIRQVGQKVEGTAPVAGAAPAPAVAAAPAEKPAGAKMF